MSLYHGRWQDGERLSKFSTDTVDKSVDDDAIKSSETDKSGLTVKSTIF